MENQDRRFRLGAESEDEFQELKKTVKEWAEEYVKEHPAEKEQSAYQLPAEVEGWLAEYTHQQDGSDLSPEAFKLLQQEFEKRSLLSEYQLALLRQNAEGNEWKIEQLEKQFRERDEERWWEEHHGELPPRNLLTHFTETATAIADIEGSGWAQEQPRDKRYSTA